MDYLIVKWLHIMTSTVLFGTGIGSAFYLLLVSLRNDVAAAAFVTRHVVIADWLFTATTAVLQPLTGYWLMHLSGIPWSTPWVAYSVVLYVVAIGCWLPVVWLQIRLRNLAVQARRDNTPLPPEYWRDFRRWVALGFPAFFAFLGIFYLMVVKPVL